MRIRYILAGSIFMAIIIPLGLIILFFPSMFFIFSIWSIPSFVTLVASYFIGLGLDSYSQKRDLSSPNFSVFANKIIMQGSLGGLIVGIFSCVGIAIYVYLNLQESLAVLAVPFIPITFVIIGSIVGICMLFGERNRIT